jgi:hypothetical protein
VEAVTEQEGASAWHLTRDIDGHVTERRLETRLLA